MSTSHALIDQVEEISAPMYRNWFRPFLKFISAPGDLLLLRSLLWVLSGRLAAMRVFMRLRARTYIVTCSGGNFHWYACSSTQLIQLLLIFIFCSTCCDTVHNLWLHPISPKVRKLEGSWVRRFFSPKVRKLEKKVLESERKGSVVRRSMIPKSWNMHFF